jgi:hypothetical protein
MDAEWRRLLLCKLPVLDLTWPQDIQARWWEAWTALRTMGLDAPAPDAGPRGGGDDDA